MVSTVLRMRRGGPRQSEMLANAQQSQNVEVSLDNVLQRIEDSHKGCKDVEVKGKDISITDSGCLKIGGESFSFTQWSFGQFCTKLHVPTDFVRRSPLKGPASQQALLEYWKESIEDSRLLIRVKQYDKADPESGATGRIRAVLSDRYAVFDNDDLMEQYLPLIKQYDLKIQKAYLHEDRLDIRMVWPETFPVGKMKNGEPDNHQLGYHLRNSEIGSCNLQGDMMMFRQVCTNGLILLFEKQHILDVRHIGIRRSELKNAVTTSLEHVTSRQEEAVAALTAAQEQVLHVNPEQAVVNAQRQIRVFLKSNKGSDEFTEKVLEQFSREPVATRFGVVQAITAAARSLPVTSRVDMEEAAGRYLIAS